MIASAALSTVNAQSLNEPRVAVVIVTFNSETTIAACLDSLLPSAVVSEVIVVDNGSGDATAAEVRTRAPRVRLILSGENVGFGRAANAGARAATAPLLAFVNPDCTVEPDTLPKLVSLLDNPDVWAAGPALLNARGEREFSSRGFPSAWNTLVNRRYLDAFPRSRSAELRRFLLLDADRRGRHDADWLSGALFVVRTSDFREIGGFDERFFMYYEDVDLFRRRPRGRIVFDGDAVATHLIGASSRRVPLRAGYWRVRSAWKYYRKHVRRGIVTDVQFVFATIAGLMLEAWAMVGKRR